MDMNTTNELIAEAFYQILNEGKKDMPEKEIPDSWKGNGPDLTAATGGAKLKNPEEYIHNALLWLDHIRKTTAKYYNKILEQLKTDETAVPKAPYVAADGTKTDAGTVIQNKTDSIGPIVREFQKELPKEVWMEFSDFVEFFPDLKDNVAKIQKIATEPMETERKTTIEQTVPGYMKLFDEVNKEFFEEISKKRQEINDEIKSFLANMNTRLNSTGFDETYKQGLRKQLQQEYRDFIQQKRHEFDEFYIALVKRKSIQHSDKLFNVWHEHDDNGLKYYMLSPKYRNLYPDTIKKAEFKTPTPAIETSYDIPVDTKKPEDRRSLFLNRKEVVNRFKDLIIAQQELAERLSMKIDATAPWQSIKDMMHSDELKPLRGNMAAMAGMTNARADDLDRRSADNVIKY